MNTKGEMEHDDKSTKKRGVSKQRFEKESWKLSAKIKELEEELKVLVLKAPNKEHYASQKIKHQTQLSDVKAKRENIFTKKRIVDAELREVNQEVQTKYDAIGKLKSNLTYKSPERVDKVIRKLEIQLQKNQYKATEERRVRQEISDLQMSKAKIKDLKELEEEVRILTSKQKDLRSQRDENIRLISSIKREESEAKSVLDQHKKAEDEEWAVYKESLAKRDQLRDQKDSLLRERRELAEQYRKSQNLHRDGGTRRDWHWGHLLNDPDSRTKEINPGQGLQIVTEKKKPFEEEIMHCNILLAYLEKYEIQTDEKGVDGSEQQTGVQHSKRPKDEGIYSGVQRRPSKRGRRKKHHSVEAAKKLDLHVSVVESFLSLGLQPPASFFEIPRVRSEINERKRYFEKGQLLATKTSNVRRTKSIPYLRSTNTVDVASFHVDRRTDDIENEQKNSQLYQRRHKSCPSLNGTVNEAGDSGLFFSNSTSNSIQSMSRSNSEHDLQSPKSMTSSSSFSDIRSSVTPRGLGTGFAKPGSIDGDEKQQLECDDERKVLDSQPSEDGRKSTKFSLKVHFANDVTEVLNDEDVQPGASKASSEHVGLAATKESELSHRLDLDSKVPSECLKDKGDQEDTLNEHEGNDVSEGVQLRGVTNEQRYPSTSDDGDDVDERGFSASNELQFTMDDFQPAPCGEGLPAAQSASSGRFSYSASDSLVSQPRSPGGCSPRRRSGYLDKNDDSVEVTT